MTQPKERPILFSGPMVRAILQGRKTQTRRIIKPQPPEWIDRLHGGELSKRAPYEIVDDDLGIRGKGFQDDQDNLYRCPWEVGARIWVRETFRLPVTFDNQSPSEVGRKCVESGYSQPWCPIKFEADGYTYAADLLRDFGGDWGKTRVSIHMPRWMSRMVCTVTSVRVERLQGITEADAMAEGVERIDLSPREINGMQVHPLTSSYFAAFVELWRSINGPESWSSNPWVWVVEFAKVDALTDGGDA